jgi:hypothetical protein
MKKSITQLCAEWKEQKELAVENAKKFGIECRKITDRIKSETGQEIRFIACFGISPKQTDYVPRIEGSGYVTHVGGRLSTQGLHLGTTFHTASCGDITKNPPQSVANNWWFSTLSQLKELNTAFANLSPHDIEKLAVEVLAS